MTDIQSNDRVLTIGLVLTLVACGGGVAPATELVLHAGDMGGMGSTDASGPEARFNRPSGISTDIAGNVYVADQSNHVIRKITPTGAVTTQAGTAGQFGTTDADGPVARLNRPHGVTTDSAGNLYVADEYNHTIRKITPAGAVTTFAGMAGQLGSTDGPAASARFEYPQAVAADSLGNVYVADGSSAIRKITLAGMVTTLAGAAGQIGSVDATGGAARFNRPRGITSDSNGNLYVADWFNHTIRKITPAGEVTTLAGSAGELGSTDASGSGARFRYPSGIAMGDAGNIYVADWGNYSIRIISPSGEVTTLAGTAQQAGSADGTGPSARFSGPNGVATDSTGNVYVTDVDDVSVHTIRKITPAGVVTTLAGRAGQVGSIDATGAAARFFLPNGLAADSAGNVYVADRSNQTIRKVTPAGVVTTLAGMPRQIGSIDAAGAAARFNAPIGIATDRSGNLYVADQFNSAIRKITPAGLVTTFAGTAGQVGSTDATGTSARFEYPRAIATDIVGNVYVADGSSTIRKITPAGAVTTLAGTSGQLGSADAMGATARFSSPSGIATDSLGNVYVVDRGNHTIRKITSAGSTTTFAGTAGQPGSTDAAGTGARFNMPTAIAIDGADNLYVTDRDNHTIRKISPAGVVTTIAGVPGRSGFSPGPLPGLLARPLGITIAESALYISLHNGIAVIQNRP